MLQIIAVRDITADAFNTPMFVPYIGGAIRSFGDACQSEGNENLQKHPEDFELYHLGEFEESTGKFNLLERPKQLAVGSSYKK